jgi:hypothetical protein
MTPEDRLLSALDRLFEDLHDSTEASKANYNTMVDANRDALVTAIEDSKKLVVVCSAVKDIVRAGLNSTGSNSNGAADQNGDDANNINNNSKEKQLQSTDARLVAFLEVIMDTLKSSGAIANAVCQANLDIARINLDMARDAIQDIAQADCDIACQIILDNLGIAQLILDNLGIAKLNRNLATVAIVANHKILLSINGLFVPLLASSSKARLIADTVKTTAAMNALLTAMGATVVLLDPTVDIAAADAVLATTSVLSTTTIDTSPATTAMEESAKPTVVNEEYGKTHVPQPPAVMEGGTPSTVASLAGATQAYEASTSASISLTTTATTTVAGNAASTAAEATVASASTTTPNTGFVLPSNGTATEVATTSTTNTDSGSNAAAATATTVAATFPALTMQRKRKREAVEPPSTKKARVLPFGMDDSAAQYCSDVTML